MAQKRYLRWECIALADTNLGFFLTGSHRHEHADVACKLYALAPWRVESVRTHIHVYVYKTFHVYMEIRCQNSSLGYKIRYQRLTR